MSTICGIFYKSNKSVNKQQIIDIQDKLAHWKADTKEIWVNNNIGLGCLLIHKSVNKKQAITINNCTIVSDARIDNRIELIDALKLNSNSTDPEIILNSYLKWGKTCAEKLIGDFAFAIWDETKQELYCARDHIGTRPFFYYNDNEKFVFASAIKGIKAVENIDLKVSEEWIADVLATIISEADKTFYKKIYRLLPAHFISVSKTSIDLKRYWDFDLTKETKFNNEQDYYDAFREALNEAVECRVNSNFPVASELSGGIDSSTIAALAFDTLNKENDKFFALSHVLPDKSLGKVFPYDDERKFSNLLCYYKGIENHIYVTSEKKGIIKETEESIFLQDMPSQQRLFLFSDELYEKAAENNCKTLLSGFGGDEFVTYAGAGFYQELMHKWRFAETWKNFNKNLSFFGKSKKLVSLSLRQYLPFIANLYSKPNEWVYEKFENLLLDASFSKKMNIEDRYFNLVGFPMDNSLKIRQYKRITHPHVPGRLENCNIAAKHYGLEYTYPLLDRRLMELYFSFPSDIKYKNGIGRYTFRKAIKDIVPKEIQWREDKTGATVPTVQLRFLNDLEKVKNLINESKAASQEKYIDYEKAIKYIEPMVNRSLDDDKPANPGVFFNAITVLIYQKMVREGKF